MTISTQALVRQLRGSDAGSILVRGWEPPLDPPESVATFDTGVIASYRGDFPHLSLYVTTPTANGWTRKRFDTRTLSDAIQYVEQSLSDTEVDGFWLRQHVALVNCLGEGRVNALEARFADTAAETGTAFVTWTNATTPVNDDIYDEVVEF